MPLIDSGWKYYLPDDGEAAADANEIQIYDFRNRIYDAEEAAELACEDEWSNRDGWERGEGNEFKIAVISPTGEETTFVAWHEPCIDHKVRELVWKE